MLWRIARFLFSFTLTVTAITVAYMAVRLEQLDISPREIAARARSVETEIVPAKIVGAGGRYYDAPIELPLSLPPERIPRFVADAFITREDQQFRRWWHIGINPVSLLKAVVANARTLLGGGSGRLVGGSTITQQLVKNVLLSRKQTFDRKLIEMLLALYVDAVFSKDQIMAMYLNTAFFGEGAYGIEIAARKFFGRSVGYAPRINAFEAAMLANSVQRPSYLNPKRQRALLEEKARALLKAMAAEGYTVPADSHERARGSRTWQISPFLFRDVAMRSLVPPAIAGRSDPLVVGLTIDTEAQLYAEIRAADMLRQARREGYDSSAIIVLERDGAIAAMATGHHYDGVDLVKDGRVSPGSTLKPFMYLCALEKGLRPDSIVVDERREFRPGWAPRNFDDHYLGKVSLSVALEKSLNTVAVGLFERYGPDCFRDVLARVGITLANPRAPSSVLGSEYVSLLSLAGAYATLANDGRRVEPYAVRYARTQAGSVIYKHEPPAAPKPIAPDRPYCDLMGMLRKVTLPDGTGHNAAFSHPVWGKTGTSSGFRDALFAGFTGRYIAVIWLGRQASGGVSRRETGGGLPAETFRRLMATLHAGKEVAAMPCRPQEVGDAE